MANLPDELYTASFETIRTLQEKRWGCPTSRSSYHCDVYVAKGTGPTCRWHITAGARKLETRGPPAPIGGERPFSAVICTRKRESARATQCLKNGGRGASDFRAAPAGAPAGLDPGRAARQAHARGERDLRDALRGLSGGGAGGRRIILRTDMCVGTAGAACPGTRRATCSSSASGDAGARVRRATPGLRHGDSAERLVVVVGAGAATATAPPSARPARRPLRATYDLADAGGSGQWRLAARPSSTAMLRRQSSGASSCGARASGCDLGSVTDAASASASAGAGAESGFSPSLLL